jgi:predicted N-acetyltransferase YhbS
MVTIRCERPADERAREALLDCAYGNSRHTKPSARLRHGRLPAEGLALVALERGRIVGTVRLWNIAAGGRAAVLLGPLAVHPDARRRGIGAALVARAVSEARRLGHTAILLVGDQAYYGRFGFSAAATANLELSKACHPARLLARELVAGALDGAAGTIRATGRRVPAPVPAGLQSLAGKGRSRFLPRAA